MKKVLKKFLFVLLIVTATLSSCEDTVVESGEISFNVENITSTPSPQQNINGPSKAKAEGEIVCTDLQASYVKYKIDNENFKTSKVFYINNIPWTESMPLASGNHILNEFLVYNDNKTPNDSIDDILISATPHVGSTFSSYISNPLDINFKVETDKKKEIPIETVCFQEKDYENFGFSYFKLTQVQVRQLWFFVDFCIKDKGQYVGSLYENQSEWYKTEGPYIDAPAIIKVEAWRNGVLQNTFTNSYEGEKLGVNYSDYDRINDNYELKLFILVRKGSIFDYEYFKSFYFTNNSNITDGNGVKGVIDGVLGNCVSPANTDFTIAPWMNLPSSLSYQIVANPSTLGGYVDAKLSNIPAGYELENGVYSSNCADHTKTIYSTEYKMDVYSSLYTDKIPQFARSTKWEKINWLFNHIGLYGSENWYPNYRWYDIQQFMWLYDNPVWDGSAFSGVPNITPVALKMKQDADMYGIGYRVPPGGWACILFVPSGTPLNAVNPTIQTMIVRIDP